MSTLSRDNIEVSVLKATVDGPEHSGNVKSVLQNFIECNGHLMALEREKGSKEHTEKPAKAVDLVVRRRRRE